MAIFAEITENECVMRRRSYVYYMSCGLLGLQYYLLVIILPSVCCFCLFCLYVVFF